MSISSPLLVTEVAPVLQAASNPLNAILFQTAAVEVYCGNNSYSTCLVLDSGAVMSLVTLRLVNTIRAKRLHTDMAILSLGGTTTAHNKVELLLTSIMGPDSPPLRVDAYVVDKLCDHRKQDMDEIKQLDVLKGKRLADPYISQPGRVDLLIGIKHLNRARCHMRLEDAPDRDMTAMETSLWR